MIDEFDRVNTGTYFEDNTQPKIEYIAINTLMEFPLHLMNHMHCEINICFDGEGFFGYDGNKVKVKKGSIAIVNPYANHGFYAEKSKISYYILGVDNIQFDMGENDVLVMNNCDITHMEELIEMMREIAKKNLYEGKRIMPHLLSALLHMVSSCTNTTRLPYYKGQGSSLTTRIANYIEKNYHSEINIDSLCNMFYCSKSTLLHSFKNDYGITVMNFLKQKRLKEVKFLLRITDRPISEIAQLNGFQTLPYFFKYFYRLEGMTPQQYREKYKNKEDESQN